MTDFKDRIEKAKQKIAAADAVVVGAGAGLSAAAGLDYSGPAFRIFTHPVFMNFPLRRNVGQDGRAISNTPASSLTPSLSIRSFLTW